MYGTSRKEDFPAQLRMNLQSRISVPQSSKELVVDKKSLDSEKFKGPESPLYQAICPIVYIIRIFGFAPYEFHNDILVPSNVNSVYGFVCVIIYTYVIYTILHRFTNIEMEKPLLGHTETGKAACNYSIAVFDIIMTLLSRGKFVRIWNVMQDYDVIVKNLGYARTETKTCIWSWFFICTSFLIWMAVHKFGMNAFGEPWFQNVSYMIVYVGTSISVLKFSGLVLLLAQRFDHLNIIAKKSGPLASRWLLASPVVDSKDIEYLHNALMIASERLNSLYSWSILLWLGNLCFHVVSNFFFVTQRIMMMSDPATEWKVLACLLSWVAAFLIQLILLNYACHYASSEANCMGYIMINWRRWLKMRRYENVETSIHLMSRRLNFSAAGCFNVNLPLLRSISALLTTYLVILLQFPE